MAQKIAYQGEPGANSNIACKQMFPELESVPCASFEDAFELVSSGEADLAMIPIENSIAGRVADIHILLPQSNLQIVGEFFLPIHFDLLGIPGSTIEGATEVHSHIHALGQCRQLIREHGLKPVIAGRHRRVGPRGGGVERSPQAFPRSPAGRPDLRPRRPGLQGGGRSLQHHPLRGPGPRNRAAGHGTNFPDRQSPASCSASATCPSALYKALGGFATNGVNMTRLESYMVGDEFAATMFMADVEAHPEDTPASAGARGTGVLHHRGADPRGVRRGGPPGGPHPGGLKPGTGPGPRFYSARWPSPGSTTAMLPVATGGVSTDAKSCWVE